MSGPTRIGAILLAVLTAALLVPPAGASGSEPSSSASFTVSPTISPPEGNCGVDEGGDQVRFGGNATAGAQLVSAHIREFAEDEQPVRDVDVTSSVSIAPDGTISGSRNLHFLDPRTAWVGLVVTATKDGSEATGVSNLLLVDRDFPKIVDAVTKTTTSVRVGFSEEVRAPEGDLGSDWEVNGERAALVTGNGNSRLLDLGAHPITEDAEPLTRYRPLPTRAPYEDCVGHTLELENRTLTAVDRTPPRVPVINEIAGRDATDDFAAAPDPAPPVVIGRVTDGHTVDLFLETNGEGGLQAGDTLLGTKRKEAGAPLEFRPLFDADGDYTLYVRATDVHGNLSEAADSAVYRLDRVAPKPVSAQTRGQEVVVAFDEPLALGRDDRSDWTVRFAGQEIPILRVSGEGDVRVLQTAASVPNGAEVSYTQPPPDLLGRPQGYRDEAENELASFGALLTAGLLPKILDLEPEEGAQALGKRYELEATVTDDSGTPVAGALVGVRAVSGPNADRRQQSNAGTTAPPGLLTWCVTQLNGSCRLSYTSHRTGTDTVQGWIDLDGDVATFDAPRAETRDADRGQPDDDPNQDVVTVDWVMAGADLLLDAADEEATGPIGRPHVITVDVVTLGSPLSGGGGQKVQGVNVDVRAVAGPNAGAGELKNGWLAECNTGADGRCTLSYGSQMQGEDRLQVWIDRNDDDVVGEGELLLGRTEERDADGSPVVDDPSQDVVIKTWTEAIIPILQAFPEVQQAPVYDQRTLGFIVADQGANPIAGVQVDARVISGPNAGRYLGECTTDGSGACQLALRSPAVGADVIQAWIDAVDDDIATEATSAEARDETVGNDEPDQDVVEATWSVAGAALRLDAEPERGTHVLEPDARHEVRLRVVHQEGVPIRGVPVGVDVAGGPNAGLHLGACTTSFDGGCTRGYGSAAAGIDTLIAWIDADSDGAPGEAQPPEPAAESPETDRPDQDAVEVEWAEPEVPTRVVTLSASDDLVTLGGRVLLSGEMSGTSDCGAGIVEVIQTTHERTATAARVETTEGAWSVTIAPRHNATYSARARETDGCPEAVSESDTVAVKAKLKARAKKGVVRRGRCTRIVGRVAPNKAGQRAVLQKRRDGVWVRRGGDVLSERSRFGFRRCFRTRGRKVFRVRWRGDEANVAALSPRVVVRVRRWRR